MTLLVVGASGHLGVEVCRRAVAAGWPVLGTYHRQHLPVEGVHWRRLDLRDFAAVRELLRQVRPRAVVNASYRYDDWAVTADGAACLALAAADAGARLVHLSSEAVHGGRPEPYLDDEKPTPVYPYGAAKAAAETAVRLAHPAAVLLRSSLIVGAERCKQVRLCLDALTGVPGVMVFSDLVRCPVSVADLADAVLEMVGSDYAGLLNLAGPEPVSRVELARLVARRHRLDPERLRISTIAEAGLRMPAEVRLDSSRAAGLLKTRLRPVSELFPAG